MTTLSILDQALARIDGYRNTGDDLRRMTDLENALRALDLPAATKQAYEAHQAALHGDDARAVVDTRRAWHDALRDANLALEAARDLRTLREFQQNAGRGLGAETTAPALEWLHAQLQDLLRTVRDADLTLGTIRTADDALHGTGEQIDAWRSIDAAVRTYSHIRAAQKHITTTVTGKSPVSESRFYRLYDAHGLTRDAYDTESHYLVDRARNGRRGWRDGHAEAFIEWRADVPTIIPVTRDTRSIWPDGESQHEHLRRLARDGNAWVPTVTELETVGTAIDRMEKPLTDLGDLRLALDAYDTYFTARGITPRVPFDTAATRDRLPATRRGGRRVDDPVQVSPAVLAATSK